MYIYGIDYIIITIGILFYSKIKQNKDYLSSYVSSCLLCWFRGCSIVVDVVVVYRFRVWILRVPSFIEKAHFHTLNKKKNTYKLMYVISREIKYLSWNHLLALGPTPHRAQSGSNRSVPSPRCPTFLKWNKYQCISDTPNLGEYCMYSNILNSVATTSNQLIRTADRE